MAGKGDILQLEDQSHVPAYGVALKDGDPKEVPVRMLNGETVRLNEQNEYTFVTTTDSTADVFIQELTEQIEGIATKDLERDIAQETAAQILDYTVDQLADTSKDLHAAAEQAVEEALKNHPKVLDALTHEKTAELVEFAVSVFRDAMMGS